MQSGRDRVDTSVRGSFFPPTLRHYFITSNFWFFICTDPSWEYINNFTAIINNVAGAELFSPGACTLIFLRCYYTERSNNTEEGKETGTAHRLPPPSPLILVTSVLLRHYSTKFICHLYRNKQGKTFGRQERRSDLRNQRRFSWLDYLYWNNKRDLIS